MRIKIKDDNENWLKWGRLVNTWIDDVSKAPVKVKDLRQQLLDNDIEACVEGSNDRDVTIEMYVQPDDNPNDDREPPLQLNLPNPKMRDKRIADDVGPGPYKLPLFYDTFYGGARRAPLSAQEAQDHAIRRIGEYTVNECC